MYRDPRRKYRDPRHQPMRDLAFILSFDNPWIATQIVGIAIHGSIVIHGKSHAEIHEIHGIKWRENFKFSVEQCVDHWKRDPWIACIACIACIALVIDIGRSWKRDRQIEERDKFNVTIQRKWRRCSILKKGKGRVRSFKNWKILRHSARLGSIWVPPTLIDFFFNIWNFIIIFHIFNDKEY